VAFVIDDVGYVEIAAQVRTNEFDSVVTERVYLAEQDNRNAVELAKTQTAAERETALAAKGAQIQGLKARLVATKIAPQRAVADPVATLEKERDALASQLRQGSDGARSASELAQTKFDLVLECTGLAKAKDVQRLKSKLVQAARTK
jgi:hypothetical protein